ncbi:MAG: Rrf2 family transcriptional regulator [Syntrophobacteraceae bacterium]
MKLSTRGRYGVRLMLDLALHAGNGPVSLRDIAARQEISEKYLSNLIPALRNSGLVNSVRGAQGGYVLAKKPREITLKDILLVLEGPMHLVECAGQPEMCSRSTDCLVRDIWSEVGARMLDTLESFTLESMVEKQKHREKVPSYSI